MALLILQSTDGSIAKLTKPYRGLIAKLGDRPAATEAYGAICLVLRLRTIRTAGRDSMREMALIVKLF